MEFFRHSDSMRIAFVCDFFYPRLGGVEMHLYSLAQHLIRLQHKVVIITHAYGKRKGVRYLPGPLKVYYCPFMPMIDQDTIPTFSSSLPLMRHILIRERIQIVHAHQATSTMANESLVYAAALGLASVYTDHSLFGFDDVASVILNRVLQATLSTVDAAIAVSHVCRHNLILRAKIQPDRIHVIPNAIDPTKFIPDPSRRSSDRIKVVVISRLVYRKGVDLLVGVIPIICQQVPEVDFIIGGDGNRLLALQEMVEQNQLQDRVCFLGAVPHNQVRDVLCQGHIFLNCSLTESFCIALLEAACCGLLVVSTCVGGVPEVLPEDMIILSDPTIYALVLHLKLAVRRQQASADAENVFQFHNRVKEMYSWERVAEETIKIYRKVEGEKRRTLWDRLQSYASLGLISGFLVCLLIVTLELWLVVIEWWQPYESIDQVPDLPSLKAKKDDLVVRNRH
jgi:phosphatidylinositol N-acetylglucosaminyltransferase subunit A